MSKIMRIIIITESIDILLIVNGLRGQEQFVC